MHYQKKIIAYLDILGFKSYIERTKSPDKQNDLYKALFAFKSSEQINIMKYPSRMASHFSDLLVITVDDNRAYLNQLAQDIIQLAHTFLESTSLLLRGIIVKGEIIHDNGIIFGPGLIDAYEKERKIVKYPRIIIDESLYEPMEDGSLSVPVVMDFRVSGVDSNAHFFIDYISSYIDCSLVGKETEYGCFNNRNLISLIKKGIISDDTSIKEKYRWIIERHNIDIEIYSEWHKIDPEISKEYLIKI